MADGSDPASVVGEGKTVLIIDGSYLSKVDARLSRSTGRRLDRSLQGIRHFIRTLENALGARFSAVYHIDSYPDDMPRSDGRCVAKRTLRIASALTSVCQQSECDSCEVCREKYAQRLMRAGIRVQRFGLKTMDVVCPNKRCPHSASGNPIRRIVQAGCDVAIATRMLTLCCEGEMDTCVLLAGDGDFEEAVQFVRDNRRKRFVIVASGASIAARLISYASRLRGAPHVVYLEDIWPQISFDPAASAPRRGPRRPAHPAAGEAAAPPSLPPAERQSAAMTPEMEETVDQLVSMGFSVDCAEAAVRSHGEFDGALEWCLHHSDEFDDGGDDDGDEDAGKQGGTIPARTGGPPMDDDEVELVHERGRGRRGGRSRGGRGRSAGRTSEDDVPWAAAAGRSRSRRRHAEPEEDSDTWGLDGEDLVASEADNIATLVEMGFEREAATHALRAVGNNVDEAAARLVL